MSDDDVRVEFGRAHDYACMIAEQENGLELLTSLLSGNKRQVLTLKLKILLPTCTAMFLLTDCYFLFIIVFVTEFEAEKAVIAELLPTLSRLAVRNEFCQKIVELGGLQFVVDVLDKYYEDKQLVESSFNLIKSLAGNDDVKRAVTKGNAIALITTSLDRHKVKFL